jgi:hypothetical protein
LGENNNIDSIRKGSKERGGEAQEWKFGAIRFECQKKGIYVI